MTTTTGSRTTALRNDVVGVPGIIFFVISAQAPLTGIVGAAGLAVALGNGAGAPGAYLAVGLVIILFSVGFTTMTRHVDTRGGFYALVRAGLGRNVAPLASWLALLTYNAIQAAMYGLFGATAADLLEQYVGISVPWWGVVGLTVAAVLAVGMRNIETGARVMAVLVTAEIAILIALMVGVIATGAAPEGFDLAASFSPRAVLAGAPGVAIIFAIASLIGFESTAIYADEAKDAQRTVPRATYAAVTMIAAFFALMMFVLVSYYGAGAAQGAALETLATDPAEFVLAPMTALLGSWAAEVTAVLLCTSLFAGLLAFHNVVNRYLHSMATHRDLPAGLARTNRHQAPAAAGLVQTVVVLFIMAPFVITGQDPVLALFGWLSGQAVAALMVLYILTSIAIIAYFRRHRALGSTWSTLVAPSIALTCLIGELVLIVTNFETLTGGGTATQLVLLASVPLVAVAGWTISISTRGDAAVPAVELAD
ncbi:MAG: APC family permease [Actinomycetota bacterium]|nr:APC family permease [Actinomycetota bacterium]